MKRHLKRIAAPATWNVKRKNTKFIVRPHPSGHKISHCIPLNVFMKELTNIAKTTKEVKAILHNKKVYVNGRRRTDHRSAVGFLDVIEFEETNDIFRIILNKNGQITFIKIPQNEAAYKIYKIIGKKILKGNKLQINLNDGQNYLANQNERYNVGGSLFIDIKNNKIIEYLPFEKNVQVLLTAGKRVGEIGKVISIEKDMVTLKLLAEKESKNEYQTTKKHAFVVGKDRPLITVCLA